YMHLLSQLMSPEPRTRSKPYPVLTDPLHVLPGGFVRLRHFGFLANRQRGEHIARCRQFLTSQNLSDVSAPAPAQPVSVRRICPLCGGAMEILERLTAQQIAVRCVGGQSFVDTS